MWNPRAFKIGLCFLSAAAAVLLFVGGPDYYSPRALRLAWDLGHLLAFFVWTTAALSANHRFVSKPLGSQMLIALPIVLLAGFGVEWAQSALGRSFALMDIANNVLGSATAIVFLSPARLEIRTHALRATQGTVVALVLLQLLPLARVVIDDVIAWNRFPVLSDFETPFELSRWTSRSAIAIGNQIARQGRASLRVPLTTEKYSGASLRHFPPDWEGYAALHLSIYNESQDTFVITLSVHDMKHVRTGRAYSDRFNARFTLQRGWNEIEVSLDKIRNAPKRRLLDLRRVRDISVITVALPKPRVIYVDNIHLKK